MDCFLSLLTRVRYFVFSGTVWGYLGVKEKQLNELVRVLHGIHISKGCLFRVASPVLSLFYRVTVKNCPSSSLQKTSRNFPWNYAPILP